MDVQKHSVLLLNGAILSYTLFVMLFVTLTPFSYHIPKKFYYVMFWNVQEALQNIFLFIPFGYLSAPLINARPGKRMMLVTVTGFTLSMIIEINQIFIYERYTSPVDVLTNTSGAVTGAVLWYMLDKISRFKERGGALLRIPLMNVVILVIPLLWLNAVSTGHNINRLWSALLPGLMSVVIISAIYTNGSKKFEFLTRKTAVSFFSIWFLIAYLPEVLFFPGRCLFFYLFLISLLTLLLRRDEKKNGSQEKRYEIPTLKKIAPLFAVYLVLITTWPLTEVGNERFTVTFLGNLFMRNNSLRYIFAQMEYMAACALLGYILAQAMNRHHFRVGRFIALLGAVTLIPELPRAFHPLYGANITHWFMAVFNGIFGGLIYFYTLSVYLETWLKKTSSTVKNAACVTAPSANIPA